MITPQLIEMKDCAIVQLTAALKFYISIAQQCGVNDSAKMDEISEMFDEAGKHSWYVTFTDC